MLTEDTTIQFLVLPRLISRTVSAERSGAGTHKSDDESGSPSQPAQIEEAPRGVGQPAASCTIDHDLTVLTF